MVDVPEHLYFPLYFAHAKGAVDVFASDEFDGNLLSPLAMETEFDFAKLAFS